MSGYDKRVRVGVDADAAVDKAIEKLLELKSTADALDGKKSTITAKVKPDTSEVDELQGKTITIPAVLDLVGKTGNLSKNQKKAIESSVKAAQDFANKVATKSGSKGVRDLQKYYQLSNKELDGAKRGMPKELLTGSKEYEDLYKQRVTHSAGMKWLQKQTEEIDSFLSGNFNSEKQYLEAIQERSRQITNVQNVLKGNWENMGEYKPSSKNTKNDDKKITTYVAGLQEKLQDSILGHFDLSQVISNIESGDYSGISTQISSQVKQMEKAIEEIIPKERNYQSRLNTALKKVGITSKQAYDNLVKDPHFGLDKIKTKGKVDNTKVDEIIDDLLETQTGDPTYASISKFLSSFIAYKRRNATGLSKEEQGFYQALYDRLSTYQDFTTNAEGEKKNLKYDASDVISALNSAWDNLHTQRQAIEDKSNEIEGKIGTTKFSAPRIKSNSKIHSSTPPITQEESAKQNENRYKVVKGPKLKSISTTPTTNRYKVVNAPKLKPTISTTSTTTPASSTPPVIPTTPPTPSGSGRPANNPPSIPPSNSSPAPNIPNFDAMQLLAENTAKNGNKITKVYKDVNRKVHTLTHTYDEANDTWSSTVDTGIKFEKLEEESAKNASALASNRQKLYAESTKPSSQRDSKKIANLRSEIIRLENQQQKYDSIARAYDQDSTSDYSMLQYRQQVAKKMEPNWSKLRDQNINAVNSNKEAYQKEREKTQKQQTQGILDQYSNAVKQAQKLNQVNKEILDVQKQLDDKSNTGADKTKLQSDLRDLKNQKTSLEKDLNAFKISDFIVQNKDLLESQGKDIDEFGKAMRQAEKSNSSLRNYSQNKISDQIISQYEDLMFGLSELEKKNKELSSAKSKGSSDDVIKNLRKEIEQKQQNLGNIDKFIQENKNTLGENRVNAFNTQKSKLGQAEQNVYDAFQQDVIKQKTSDFTSQYDSAIAKVKELKQAQVDLMNAQNEYKINSTDNAVAQRFEDAKQRVEALKTEVDSFYKDTYTRDKDNNGILNTKKANEYEKAYLSAQTAESNYHKNLVADMKEQYSLQTKAERELIKLSASDKYSQQEHMLLSAAQARAKQSYENMYKEVSQIYGKDYADTQMQDLISQSNVSKNNTINSNFASLSKDIDSFVSKIQNAGRASESFKSQFSSLSSGLDTATTEFKNGSISVNDYVSRMLELRNQTEAYKDYYQNGLGVKDLDYFQAHEKLIKYTNIGDKTGFYQAKLDGFHSRYEELNDTFKNSTKGQKDIEAYSKGIDELVASMEKFGKTSDGLNKTTSKGTMIENTAHQIKDTADASKALTDYAASIGLTNKISQSINDSTGKVTMNFETASGDIVKLTGNIEKTNDSLRVMYENTTKASTGFTSFSQGIKGLISGNFQGALSDITQYVANFQIMYKAINQMKQGFSTFMDYNKALTTISYTMDMSQDQLQSLGTSAVDMAKDLSMSLDNTMDIYQIYANMNTSSKEIQETAKPTAILSNLSGVDASTAADQVQGILQQFHMLEDGSTSAADASMHVVDVMDKISSNVGMDYAKFLAHILEIIYCSQTKIGED